MKTTLHRTLTAIVVLVLSAAASVKAETHYKPHISVGAHGGMSMSKMSFSPSIRQSWLYGYEMGVAFRYAEEKLFGIVGELNLEQRGWREDFKDSPLNYTRTLTYLQLPVMTHISYGTQRFKGFVNLGPVFGLMVDNHISANFDYEHPQSAPGFPTSPRMTEQMKAKVSNTFDYGITAGLGGEYYLSPRHSVYLQVRYYYGLGNIFPATKADTFSASRSMSLSFTAGYFFRLK